MPEIGVIKRATEVGFKGSHKVVWHACVDCGKERWVKLRYKLPQSKKCRSCAQEGRRGVKSGAWKGGRRIQGGYIEVRLQPDDFFYPMTRQIGYVREHRLVMAKHLNRCLLSWEIVHHKGVKHPLGSIENKQDNRLENLELIKGHGRHNTQIERELKALQDRVTLLEAENILLREQLKSLADLREMNMDEIRGNNKEGTKCFG